MSQGRQRHQIVHGGAAELNTAKAGLRPREFDRLDLPVVPDSEGLERGQVRQRLDVLQLAAEESQVLQAGTALDQAQVKMAFWQDIEELEIPQLRELLPTHEPHGFQVAEPRWQLG